MDKYILSSLVCIPLGILIIILGLFGGNFFSGIDALVDELFVWVILFGILLIAGGVLVLIPRFRSKE